MPLLLVYRNRWQSPTILRLTVLMYILHINVYIILKYLSVLCRIVNQDDY